MSESHSSNRVLRPWMLPVSVLLLGLVELGILVWISSRFSVWWALLVVVLGWIAGFALLVAAGQQSLSRILSVFRALRGSGSLKKHMTRPVFTALSAFLFFFPGVLTDIAAIVLLLTPVQKGMLSKAGLSSAERTVLFSRRRGGIIEGEVVIDTTPGAGGSSSAPTAGASQAGPPLLEGDVKDDYRK